MRKNISYFVILFLIVLVPLKVNAVCSDEEIVRLQKIANNVNVSYQYNKETEKFDIYISNLKKSLILEDKINQKKYNIDGEVVIKKQNSGIYKYYIYSANDNCNVGLLIMKYFNIPYYNEFYQREECKIEQNNSYCNKWLSNNITYDEWKNKIKESKIEDEELKEKVKYNNLENYILKFYFKYYYILLPLAIMVLSIVIYIKNKKEKIV